MIGTGAMSDPYIPLEQTLGMTRKALELIEKYGFGVAIQTKSDKVLRDLELLKAINDRTKAVVQMTLTTADEKLCRLIEPNVATTARRVAALEQLRDAGIPTVVWISPILPFINDTEENLRGILEACIRARVRGIINFGFGVTLRDGDREYFYSQLDRKFPGMKERYIRTFGNAYEVNSPRNRELTALLRRICGENGILCDNEEIFRYMSRLEDRNRQLSFF